LLHRHTHVTLGRCPWVKMSGVPHQPQGAAFDIVLLLHVACVVVGLATTVTSAATATRVRRLIETRVVLPETVLRYFRPGVNWAGRAVYGVPVFGFALLAMSQGAYALQDGWVLSGLAIFAMVALLGEGSMWPAERRLQLALVDPQSAGVPPDEALLGDVKTMAWSATACVVLLLLGSVLMVAQP
jgi:hypothetical protein